MPVQPATEIRPDINRLVWVENLWDHEYTEEFRGDVIKIPAKGRIKMPILAAEKFLSQAKQIAKPLPDGSYKSGVQPKMLRKVELTEEERKEIEGVTPQAQKEAEKQATEKASFRCVMCGFQAVNLPGLKRHVTTTHKEEPVGDISSVRRGGEEATSSGER